MSWDTINLMISKCPTMFGSGNTFLQVVMIFTITNRPILSVSKRPVSSPYESSSLRCTAIFWLLLVSLKMKSKAGMKKPSGSASFGTKLLKDPSFVTNTKAKYSMSAVVHSLAFSWLSRIERIISNLVNFVKIRDMASKCYRDTVLHEKL